MTIINTYTGKQFDLLDPKVEMIDLTDICESLSKQCRYNGHIKQFYSVAEHSYRVANIVSDRSKPWALMHDAAEAYIGDIIRPMRLAIKSVSAYGIDLSKNIEGLIAYRIREKFNIEFDQTIHDEVDKADNILIATEGRDLFPFGIPEGWMEGIEPLEEKIYPVTSNMACSKFLIFGNTIGLWY